LKKIISLIIGISVSVVIFIHSPVAHALYSPVLSDEVSAITKDIVQARQTNGVKSFATIHEEAKGSNESFLNSYMSSIKEVIIKQLTTGYLDDLSLLLGWWIDKKEDLTNCLRDDIWALKAVQEQVLSELLKAVILSDYTNSSILWQDYQLLNKRAMDDLKKTYKDTKTWFPKERNYYVDCPYEDFKEATDKLQKSFENLKNTFEQGTLELGSFASIKEAAKKRAIRKAKKWIAENKIGLTLGGKEGNSPTSLFNGPGLDGLVADIETELKFVEKFGDLEYEETRKSIAPDGESADYEQYARSYTNAKKAKDLVVDQMETSIKYNLNFNNVSEQSLIGIEKILIDINSNIEQAYDKKANGDPNNLTLFCEQLNKLAKRQCKNHAPKNFPSCKY